MISTKKFFTMAILASAGVIGVGSPASAAIRYLVNFDQGVQSPGPNPYSATGGEILPAGITGNNLSAGDPVSGNLVNPPVTGPQGGQAFEMLRGASWPNQQGLRFGADNNGGFTGTTGPVIANAWTIEAIVRPNFANTGFGQSQLSQIFNSQHLGDGSPWGDIALYVDQTTGLVHFEPNGTGLGNIDPATVLQADQWYHIAAMVRPGATQQTELWINGVLAGTGAYPAGWEVQNLNIVPGYFNVGSWYWATSRNFQGYIDAFAISDTVPALDGSSGFALFAPVPEPSTAALLSIGMMLVGYRRRQV